MTESNSSLLEKLEVQFRDLNQQAQTATIGMWLFLATEVMFFGGLIACYIVYWFLYAEDWSAGSRKLNLILGTVNTFILLTSSLFVALGVAFGKIGEFKKLALSLMGATSLGILFLFIKGYEWLEEYRKGLFPGRWISSNSLKLQEDLFFRLYFVMTGIHALHVLIGIVLLMVIVVRAFRGSYCKDYLIPVSVSSLYWHFVDVVWIFLFPLLYLIDRSK